jgi:hypothetical protein
MMRKARAEMEDDNRQNYEKKAAELDKKDKVKQEQPPTTGGGGDWFDNLKSYGVDD